MNFIASVSACSETMPDSEKSLVQAKTCRNRQTKYITKRRKCDTYFLKLMFCEFKEDISYGEEKRCALYHT